ncbi:MAG: hypothetical protein ACK5HT_14350, partial [Draconibacterium sp.]
MMNVFFIAPVFDIVRGGINHHLFGRLPKCQHPKQIKKILEVDYPRGRAKEYYANFISAKSLKTEFSLFHPSV